MSEPVIFERNARVVTAKLNRPDAMNALNFATMLALTTELKKLDQEPDVGCFVLTGSPKAFAAGADIKEMVDLTYEQATLRNWCAGWEAIANLRTPIIAAVSGFALGGGCELAMMCDIIIAGQSAKFGQPEIKLGIIPGMGGSQRLTRAIGKAKAMDMTLTGRMMDADEAERCGLVARVVADVNLMQEALTTAQTIASFGKISSLAAKAAIQASFELPLAAGLNAERQSFHAQFGTADQKQAMQAFLEKRKANFHD